MSFTIIQICKYGIRLCSPINTSHFILPFSFSPKYMCKLIVFYMIFYISLHYCIHVCVYLSIRTKYPIHSFPQLWKRFLRAWISYTNNNAHPFYCGKKRTYGKSFDVIHNTLSVWLLTLYLSQIFVKYLIWCNDLFQRFYLQCNKRQYELFLLSATLYIRSYAP